MTELWIHTRHCPNCDDVELATNVVDKDGRVHTWCNYCGRTLRKYDENGELEWEDTEWAANERPDVTS